ncbi:MAG TPA: ABC transporter permease, partial [Candidatus Methylomirabilis sp.]|nr:ABC transporter permease [Candidatus Methylomirabilis sp.]
MRRYLAYRVLSAIFVLVGITFVVFLALHVTPGDPAQILLGPMATPSELGALRQQLGLDRPFLVQYWRWAGQVAQGDFGRSIMLRRPVLPELWRRFHATALLAGGALALAFPLGVAMGVVSAVRRESRIDRLSQVVAMVGISMPAFWVGLLLIIGFSVRLGWLPGTGMYSPVGDGGLRDLLSHLILPAVTLSLVPLAVFSR